MKVLENAKLSNFSTIKIGGIAKKIYIPENIDDVKQLIYLSRDTGKHLIPIGVGSNIIFKDGVLDHIFVSTKLLKDFSIKQKGDEFVIYTQAGVSFKTIVSFVKKHNLQGFENLSGIPASIGGAVAMNAGAFGSEIFDLIYQVDWIDYNGNLHFSKKEEIYYSYRKTQFQKEGFVVGCYLRLKKSNKNISRIIKEHLILRNKKQPLDLPTTGSTYKNPDGTYAGFLLEKAGFKGYKIGDVGFSKKHSNFLVNYSQATFKDLMRLLEIAEKKVEQLFNIKLEREIKIVE